MADRPSVEVLPAGEVDGRQVLRFLLDNAAGMTVAVLSFGGIVESVSFPDRRGDLANVALGYGSLEEYVALNAAPSAARPAGKGTYFGALIGRYANRIAGGSFELDGSSYALSRNDGTSCMHGGELGFDQRNWEASALETDDSVGVRLEYESPAGEMGFPGRLHAAATYRLAGASQLALELSATTDVPTICDLTSHCYWNLGGESCGSALDHVLSLEADHYLPVDEALIPTGELRAVAGTTFDFRRPVPIAAHIRDDDDQLVIGRGYDHCFALRPISSERPRSREIRMHSERQPSSAPSPSSRLDTPAARLLDPASGRSLTVYTSQPGLQLYSGNFLDGSVRGRGGRLYRQGDGIALEPEHYPDSPNRPDFPSAVLRAGETYKETIVFELSNDG